MFFLLKRYSLYENDIPKDIIAVSY